MLLETKNTNLETPLAATKEKLEHMQDQLTRSEEMVKNLEEQLASAQESNQLFFFLYEIKQSSRKHTK